MHVRAKAEKHVKTNHERAGAEQPTALLASAPIRIWLVLLMTTSSIAIVAAITDLIAAPQVLERIPLSLQILVGAVSLSLFSFSIGAASTRPVPGDERTGTAPRPVDRSAGNGMTARGEAGAAGGADVAQPTDTLPTATDAAARAALPVTGPRWLMWIDDRLTRPISRTGCLLAVVATSGLSGYAAWHWFGGLGEAATVLLAVAILSGLFSRVSAMAARSRQTVDELRTTNDQLLHEIVKRRLKSESDEAGAATQTWVSDVAFDDARVQDIEALRTKFLNEVSHELRGPITAINLAARIIMKHHVYDHDVVERFGSTIVTEGDRLAHIVNDFLELAKIESGCATWQEDHVNSEDIVKSALFSVESLAAERNITLRAEVEDDPNSIMVDRDRIVQAVTILASNVVRAAREGATVSVHARRGNQETLFAAEEKGAIAAPKKVDIFKAAAAESKSASHDGSSNGHGLALCIASEIAGHYGGELWIEGRTDSGSAILISIPDEDTRPAAADRPHHRDPQVAGASGDGNENKDTTRGARSATRPMPLIGQPGYIRPGASTSEPAGDSLSEYLGDEGYGEGEEAAYIAETTLAADEDDGPRRDALADVLEPVAGSNQSTEHRPGLEHDENSGVAAHFESHTTRVDAMSAASEAAASAYGEDDPFDPQTFFDAPYGPRGDDGQMPSFEEDLASMERYERMLEEVLGNDSDLAKDFESLSDNRDYVDALHTVSRPKPGASASDSHADEGEIEPTDDADTDADADVGVEADAAAHATLLTKVKSGFGFSLYKSSRPETDAEVTAQEDAAAADPSAVPEHSEGSDGDEGREPADEGETDGEEGGDGSAGGASPGGDVGAPVGETQADFEPLSIAALPTAEETPAKWAALAAAITKAVESEEKTEGSRSAGMLAALPGAKVRDKTSLPTVPKAGNRNTDVMEPADAKPAGKSSSHKEHGG